MDTQNFLLTIVVLLLLIRHEKSHWTFSHQPSDWSNSNRRGQRVAAICSYTDEVSPRVVDWAHPPACCHHQRGHSRSSTFPSGSKHIWKMSGTFQWFLTHTTPSSSGVLGMAGQVMPEHSIDAPIDKSYWKDTEASLKQNQHKLKCTVVLYSAPFQQLGTHTVHGSIRSDQIGKTCS